MKTIVQLVLIDETGDSYYRMRWPGKALCDQDPSICLINLDARAEERFELALNADLLVLFQSNDLDMIEVIEKRKRANKKTIVEYNDNFYAPPPCSPVFGPWSSPLLWQTYETIMQEGDHLIVTGEGLKELLSPKVNCPISILENHIYETAESFETCFNSSKELIIGWAGSVGHMSDLLAILPTLEEFCRAHPNAKLHLMGNESIPGYVSLPTEKFSFTPWGTMSDYYAFLKGIHLGIAPLADSDYNHCRSDIKAIEYASRGVLPLVQKLTPYLNLIEKGIVTPFDSFSELYNCLQDAYDDRNKLKEKAKIAYDFVLENRTAQINKERLELYLNLAQGESENSLKLEAGYHEVMGTASTELECMKIVSLCQEQMRKKEFAKAIETIKTNKTMLRYEPNLNLLLAECIKPSDVEEAEEILNDAGAKFPQDLRFKFQALKLFNTTTQRHARWANLVDYLERQPETYRVFYAKSVCSSYLLDVEQKRAPLEIGLKLCEIYPLNIHLLSKVGELCFKEKNYFECIMLLKKAQKLEEALRSEGSPTESKKDNKQYLLTLIEAAEYSLRMLN